MAVETRYVVIRNNRNNEEQEVMTFTDKRAADEHDRMLDMADAMFEILHAAPVELDESQCDDLSVFLAKQREDILYALQAKKKPTATKKPVNKKSKSSEVQSDLLDEEQISAKSLSETLIQQDTTSENSEDDKSSSKSKKSNGDTKDDKLVDFVIEKDEAA